MTRPSRSLVLLFLLTGSVAVAQPGARPARCGDVLFGESIDCRSTGQIALVNAGVTAGIALVRAAVEGRVDSWRDVLDVAGAGAASGVGFALAKRAVAQGHIVEGRALGFASASVLENVIEGDHPLARIRVGVAAGDVRVRTPWARLPGATVAVEVDPLAAGALVALPAFGYRPEVGAGALVFLEPEPVLVSRPTEATVAATTYGRVVMARRDVAAESVQYELVHVVQSQQIGVAAPFGTLGQIVPWARRTSFGGRVSWDLRAGAGTGLGAALHLIPYARRPIEIEAYSLTAVD